MTIVRFLAPLVTALLVAACSGTEKPADTPDQNADLGPDAEGDGPIFVPVDAAEADAAEEKDFGTGWEVEVSLDYVPNPGEFLWPCKNAEDCLSEFCIETMKHGPVCTIFCEEECPLNWRCKSKQIGSDVVYLCVPPETELCLPCTEDKDCGQGNHCLVIGNLGAAACTIPCEQEEDCPTEYGCKEVAVREKTELLCWPKSDSCV